VARSPWRLRIALFLAVGFGITGLWLVAFGTGVFDELDLDTVDWRFSVRGEKDPAGFAIVAIDDVTFDEYETYPLPRRIHAGVIRRLKGDGARLIGYDIQFSEEAEDPADDNALMDAARAAGNVVFATTEVAENGDPKFVGYQQGSIEYARAGIGNGNFEPDPGGIIRRLAHRIDRLKSFAVVAAERINRRPVDPFDPDTTWIDYLGGAETIPTYSLSQVAKGRFSPGAFRGRIVVVGASAPTLQDLHPVSFGDDEMPGPEIQANAISTVLRGLPITSVAGWVDLLLVIGLGMLAPVASLKLNLRGTLILAILAAAAFLLATQGAFQSGWVNSFVYPFGALTMSSVGAIGSHYLLAAFERERVRDVFARFVPAPVVEDVLKRTDKDLRLGGETVEATVMFTDLRGFTSVSEALPAVEVIQIVNYYLSEMTDAIHAHGGTLVSYEGDGIMAVFGAPLEQPDHADRAIAASREMLSVRLERFNQWLREREIGDGFLMGIGLNSGDIVSGMVGAENRLEYTAIGDTTNTAARLQGMTKGTPHSVFIADSTRQLLQRPLNDLIFVDEFEVRGRQAKVKLWSIPEGAKT
jgi:adenylate cyclase